MTPDSIVSDFDAQLSPAERALLDRARDFSRRVVAPHARQWDLERRHPTEALVAACDERLAAVELAPEFGGAGLRFSAKMTVLATNGPDLATVALRPHLIWGPGDTNLVPQLLARARAGELRFVGDGSNLVDTIYIDNAADAHLLAADRLEPGAACAGKAHFVSNGDPWPLKKNVNGILEAGGLPPQERGVSLRLALIAGALFEAAHRLIPSQSGPRMTPFIARNFATPHWFDISAARRDLGYEPEVSIEEGLRRLSVWLMAAGGSQDALSPSLSVSQSLSND